VLFVGGTTDRAYNSDAVDVYNSATGQWSSARLAHPDTTPSVIVVGTQVLITTHAINVPLVVDIYDSATGQWSQATIAQTYYGLPDVVTVGTQAVFSIYGAVASYDSVTRQWSTIPIPYGKAGSATASVGTMAVFVDRSSTPTPAGPTTPTPETSGSTLVANVYDTATGQWRSQPLSQWRMNCAVATVGTQVLFAGGSIYPPEFRTKMIHFDAVDIYDVATGTASTSTLALARETPRVETVGTQVLFIGGTIGCTGCPVDRADLVVDVYDSAAGQR